MGLLESVIGGVLNQVIGQVVGGRGRGPAPGGTGGLGGLLASPLARALLMLVLAKGASGGFGDIFGRGRGAPDEPGGAGPYGRDPGQSAGDDAGDIGGFDQGGGRGGQRGDYSDLAGMLDGPGGGGGLDGLAQGFKDAGLGHVMESWIGRGENHGVAPEQLGQALGPGTLDSLSRETGLDRDTLLSQLAQVLPQVVDRLTPHGRMPDADERRGW